jgi:hypothetical protein
VQAGWIQPAQDIIQWQNFVKTLMNIGIPEQARNFMTGSVSMNFSTKAIAMVLVLVGLT